MHILARCEINHKVSDIGNEIYKQNMFISEDPSVLETEVIQNVGEDADVYHVKFKKFLMAEQPDAVVLVQKIQHRDSSRDNSIVIPVVSINHYKKKPVEGWERLEVKVGGWVLKPLGATKTLVNVFLNVKFPKTRVPEVVLSKHAKSLVSMLRTLESLCNKTYFNYRFGSKIFEKTQTIILDENNQSRMTYIPPELDEEEEKLVDEEEEKVANGKPYVLESSNKPKTYSIKVPYPTDVEDINPDDVEDEHREYILGTRKRLTQLIDLANNCEWKLIAEKKQCRMYVAKSESGLICVKGETFFPFDAEKIIDYVKRADIRPKYDKYTEKSEIIKELPYRTILGYAKIKQILVVASRDIVIATQLITSKEQKTMYTPTFSIELPEYPPQKDPVRALVPIGGWIIQEKSGGSQVIYA